MEPVETIELTDNIDELREKVEQLGVSIEERQTKLLVEYERAIDPLNFFHARISALAQILLDERGQLMLDILTRTMITNMLDTALNQAEELNKEQQQQQNRARLVEGIPGVDPNVGMPIPQGLFTGH